MNRRQALSGVALSTIAITSGSVSKASAQQLDQLQVIEPPTEDTTNMFYAVKSGMFAKAGLDVKITYSNSGAAAVEAVVAGSFQIAGAGLLGILAAHIRGIPVTIIEPENMHTAKNPEGLLQVANDSDIRTAADLNGKVVGVSALNSESTVSVKAWSDKNGGDWHSLKFLEVPSSSTIDAIQQHRVDAGFIQYPSLAVSLAQHSCRTLGDSLSAIAPEFLSGVYVCRTDWAAPHAELIRRFSKTYLEATRYVNSHLRQTAPYVVDLTKLTLDQALSMRRTINPVVLNPALIQPVIDTAAKYGAISRSFPASELLAR